MQRNCAFCGVQFQAIRRTAKFCGNTCRARYCLQRNSPKSRKPTPPAEHECTHCGETFISTHSPKYCSKECRNSAKSYEYKKDVDLRPVRGTDVRWKHFTATGRRRLPAM